MSTTRETSRFSGIDWKTVAAAAVLVVVPFVAYMRALHAGFIWDDDLLVTANPLLRDFGGLRDIWFTARSVDYTPLTLTAFWIEWRLWANNAAGYHAVNILFHIASVLVLWRVLLALKIPGAFPAALLFAVHPVNAASVAWIAEQKNTLSLLFFLVSIFAFLHFDLSGKAALYLLAIAAAACACLAKGSTVILPPILVGCIWARHGRITRRDAALAAPFFLLAGATAFITVWFQHRYVTADATQASAAFRLIRAGDAVWFYLWKDVWPLHLCSVYPQWNIDPANPLDYLPAAGVIFALLLLWLARNSWGRPYFLALFYFVTALLPILGFQNMGFMAQTYVADWWQYIALIAVATLVAAGFARLREQAGKSLRRAIACFSVGIVAALATLTWREAEGYQSLEIYSRRTLERNPGAWGAHVNLAQGLIEQGRLQEAQSHLEEAVRLNPLNAEAHYDLGNVFRAKGELPEAVAQYQYALSIHPDNPKALNNLALTIEDLGDVEGAITQFQKALKLNPGFADAHNDLGLALDARGEHEEAIAEYRDALAAAPAFAEARYNLGGALKALGRLDEAASQYQEALRIKPAYPEAMNNLANIFQRQRRYPEAIANYREALRVEPDNGYFQFDLATALEGQGNADEAAAAYREAIRLRPGMAEAHWNLGTLLLRTGHPQTGLAEIQKAVDLEPNKH